MARKFEEIPVWQKARELCRRIYSVTKQKPFCYDRGLVDQITRAAVSVLSNIAEGVERGSTAELLQFLFIAKGSAGEVRAQLYVAEDQNYITNKESEELRNAAQEISYQLSNWIKSLQTPDAPVGPRYNKEKSKSDKIYEENHHFWEEKARKDYEERIKEK
ncbi:MAG TPA: four helix bundle protein [Lentisphaeria bacterium]|nr:MAG: hypothetical protein A2X47_10225 [Lentisphaerae bacterium GWF2_38_69]HBM15077.1 four helix bundle protein [Lentisphaeria bacterium]